MRPAAIVICCSILLFGVSLGSASAVDRKPNVIVIFADDQGALDAGCYGSTDLSTPNIDRLAKEGVRFTQAYGHTVCCPARAMIMTGRHPQRGDVNTWTQSAYTPEKNGNNLLASEVTLAEALKSEGYATALFGKWHLGAAGTNGPTKQGFDQFFGIRGGFIDNYSHYSLHGAGRHDLFEGVKEQWREGEYFMDMVLDRSLKFIDEKKDHPFFLYFPLNLPHYPEQSREEFEKRFGDLAEPRQSYAKIMATTDHYVGELLKKLDELSLRDDTIVIYTADNGYSREDYQISVDKHTSGLEKGINYGANGGGGNVGKWRGSKGSFLDGGIRVPAVISYQKKLPSGEVRDQLVTAMDWYPTVLELAEIDPPKVEFDGHSVVPIVQQNAESKYDAVHWQWQKGWAVRRGDWKLIVNGNLGLVGTGVKKFDNQMPKVFLGNLSDEQPEAKNYANEKPELVKELTELHDEWEKAVTPK